MQNPLLATASAPESTNSTHRALGQSSLPLNFQPGNKKHRDRLLLWCRESWTVDFYKPISAGNPPIYHDCCCSFSRRAFCKQAGHPELQSCAVTRIPAFKEVQTPEELYLWLLKTLQKNDRFAQHCFFPRFNAFHSEDQGIDDQEPGAVVQELRKRLHEHMGAVRHQEKTIRDLRKENDQLLHSMKSWYQKYQDLKDATDKLQPTLFNTPTKRSSVSNSVLLENEY